MLGSKKGTPNLKNVLAREFSGFGHENSGQLRGQGHLWVLGDRLGQSPNLRGQGPNLREQGPNLRGQDPNLRGQGPNLRGQGPNLRGQALDLRILGQLRGHVHYGL